MNMHFIETIYIIGALVAILAAYPQLRQLVRTKQSDEFSLSTWVVWLITQCISLAYVATLGNKIMIAVNIAWISFYFAMTILITYYRQIVRSNSSQPAEPLTEPVFIDK